jgi:hypothetical protein
MGDHGDFGAGTGNNCPSKLEKGDEFEMRCTTNQKEKDPATVLNGHV